MERECDEPPTVRRALEDQAVLDVELVADVAHINCTTVVDRTRSDCTMSLLTNASAGWAWLAWLAWLKTYSSSSALNACSPSFAGPKPRPPQEEIREAVQRPDDREERLVEDHQRPGHPEPHARLFARAVLIPATVVSAFAADDFARVRSGENGGEGGIRTLGRFPYTRFPSVRDRPLCHLSVALRLRCPVARTRKREGQEESDAAAPVNNGNNELSN